MQDIWYDKKAIVNIFSFAEMGDQYRITYDSKKGDLFEIHTDENIVQFKRSPEGLYYYNVTNQSREEIAKLNKLQLVATVNENEQGFTLEQKEQTRTAWKLYHSKRGSYHKEF